MWVPIGIPGGVFRSTESELADRADRNYGVVARLRPNATLTEVQAQLDTVAGGLHALDEVAWSDRQDRPRRFTALEEAAARVPPNFLAALTLATWIFIGAAVLVLVIACSNVAGILLARAERRRTEIAVRSALGASRRRLLGMLLAESAILASMAGVVGVLFSAWLVQRFDSISLPIGDVSLQFDLRLDGCVLLFAVALSALTALAFGLAPALRGTRAELVPALKAATGEGGGRRRLGMRGVLVATQVAVAAVFVVGAAVAWSGFREFADLDWGVDPEGFVVMSHELEGDLSRESQIASYRDLVSRLQAHADVSAVHLGSAVEGSSFVVDTSAPVFAEGDDAASQSDTSMTAVDRPLVRFNTVTPGYLEALGIRLLRGRGVEGSDTRDSVPVAVVNETFARQLWPNEDPIGQRFQVGQNNAGATAYEVVGLAADARYQGFEGDDGPFFWTAIYQRPRQLVMLLLKGRPGAGTGAILELMRTTMLPNEPNFVLVTPRSLDELMNFQFLFVRFIAVGLAWAGGFGLVALALLGLYGVVSYLVSQRTREVAVRLAVGARPAQVVRRVFHDGMRLALIGLAVGLVVAVPLTAPGSL